MKSIHLITLSLCIFLLSEGRATYNFADTKAIILEDDEKNTKEVKKNVFTPWEREGEPYFKYFLKYNYTEAVCTSTWSESGSKMTVMPYSIPIHIKEGTIQEVESLYTEIEKFPLSLPLPKILEELYESYKNMLIFKKYKTFLDEGSQLGNQGHLVLNNEVYNKVPIIKAVNNLNMCIVDTFLSLKFELYEKRFALFKETKNF